MIAEDAAGIIRSELHSDEQLLWADKPRSVPRAIFYVMAFFIISFGVLFLWPMGHALAAGDMSIFDSYNFSINGTRVTSETPVAALWMPFIVITVMMALFVGGCLLWIFAKMREAYGVTSKRVIILSRFFQRRAYSINPAMTPHIDRSGNQQIGSISFRGAEHGVMDKILALYRVRLHAFTKIRNPAQVEALIYERFIEATK